MTRPRRRRLLVPEVVQSSATDCGPACLKSLLEGHGIRASYGRLREACRTDVDGSSIDTLEQIAVELGLDAQQVMVPVEHLSIRAAGLLPALVVVRQPSGMTHFVVAWRRHGNLLQLMDPATGRRWSSIPRFEDELYQHEQEIPVEAWCTWAASEDFLSGLRVRLRQLGLNRQQTGCVIAEARSAAGWRPLAALDAATRLVAAIVGEGGLRTGPEALRAVQTLSERARDEAAEPTATIPAAYWTALGRPHGTTVRLRGAVLVTIAAGAPAAARDTAASPNLQPVLARALAEPAARPGTELLQLLRADGLLAPGVLVALLTLAAAGVLVEVVLLRALFDIGTGLTVPEQRLGAVAMLLAFVALLLGLELPIWSRILTLGRQLEGRTRLLLLERLARVHDRYFKSRLVSDMAERSHRLHELRVVPEVGAELLRAVFGMAFTTAGIVWLCPEGALPVIAGAVFCILVPLVAQPLLTECDLRLRNHAGAILKFHLDALLGIVPLRAHAAGRAMRSEHARLVAQWADAGLRLQRRVVGVEAVQSIAACVLAMVLLSAHGVVGAGGAASLLLVYWVLSLPVLGQQLGLCARRYPALRSITLRFLELLGTPATTGTDAGAAAPAGDPAPAAPAALGRGVAIRMENVSVKTAGHAILAELDLEVAAGSHVAIIGPSGAGKSSLVGLLLGWHEPFTGRVRVDGQVLDGRQLTELRRGTAWVDPGVQLWNRSLLDNLFYGASRASTGSGPAGAVGPAIGVAVDRSGVAGLLDGLPDGLQTRLGEGGALVSGGEGQRVRLARAALRPDSRLAILDEPFRGLSREVRTDLLAYARGLWRESTLLCITHDIAATLDFDRVLVIEGGRVVEDGAPRVLAQQRSRYAEYLDAERTAGADSWSNRLWRRLKLERGQLAETAEHPAA